MTTETSFAAPERSGASLAVRYRPRRFAEVVGQRHVTAVLGRAIATDRLPQQLLLSGGSGLGKTTLARVTAAALLCETPLDQRTNGDACGSCSNCIDITTPGRSHPDVIEFDAASHGGKDEIKAIADRAQLSPMRALRKIYIIDEAHGLSGPGGQAFLKLLEEPPAHVTFMLATTDPQKMLKTNRGRCTEFELLAPSEEELAANLLRVAAGEGWTLSKEAALAVVDASDASLGVRATLMSLEKLAGALDDGEELSAVDVALLLGSTAPAALSELLYRIEIMDPLGSLAALQEARSNSSDGAIRAALIDWARRGLLEAGAQDFTRATWRLSTVLDTPASTGWLELTVARLVTPEPSASTLEVLSTTVTEQVAELRSLLAELATVEIPDTAPVTVESHPSPEPEQPAAAPVIEAPATPEPAAEEPAPTAPVLDEATRLEHFMDEVSRVAPKAAALLRASDLSIDNDVLLVATSEANAKPLKAQAQPVRDAAATLGLTIRLVKRA